MEQIAEVSGGRVFFPARIEDIIPLYQQIGRELGTSYGLAYVSSNTQTVGSAHRIEVRVNGEQLEVTQSRSTYVSK
jgi:hypothetical protein